MAGSAQQVARVSESDFCTWLARAKAGDVLVYHRGVLACDTNHAASTLAAGQRIELAHLARSARWAADEGIIHLLQRREGPDQFSYLAVARPRARSQSHPIETRTAKEHA